ncbi:helix-turn-helix transcriptional regulator [Amycolatopsis sp. lyj-112]|uniref:helix-turn-helix transcriptional regulator n=1 Tax=Amycolatopsis sp. lyj-112 TaxID=2789288 RepID=UPI0039791486
MLADARDAIGHSQDSLAEELGVTGKTVSNWERGYSRPTRRNQLRLARILGLTHQEVVALVDAATAGELSPAVVDDGFDVLAMFPTLDASPAEFLAQTEVTTPVPGQVGASDVERVRAITWTVAMSENKFGGGPTCEAAAAQLRWAQRLLNAHGTSAVKSSLHEAIANLSSVVAHTAFDTANHSAADRFFRFGLWAAHEGKAWPLRANIMAEVARKQIYLGDYDGALTSIEHAQVRSDRLSNTGRAMLWAVRARLLALVGRGEETAADVARADECFAARAPEEDPPWLCYYDEAEHLGSTGKALLVQALQTNRPEIAAGRLEAAIHLHGDAYPRSRTFSRIRLASLRMATGDPVEAAAIGAVAVADAQKLSSKRILDELTQLDQAASEHVGLSEVADLRASISSLSSTLA